MHLTSSPIDWYVARAAGITAYLLVSGVVLLGLTMAAKKPFARWPRFTVEDVHRFGGLLVGSFVTIHVVTVAIDSWLPFSSAVPRRAVHLSLPADLGRARDRSRGAPRRAGRDESLSPAPAVHVLAARALPQLRRLDRSDHPRPRQRHRQKRALGTGHVRDRGLHGDGGDRVACRSGPGLARGHSRPQVSLQPRAALLVVGLATGPLHFKPRPWNAASFSEQLRAGSPS